MANTAVEMSRKGKQKDFRFVSPLHLQGWIVTLGIKLEIPLEEDKSKDMFRKWKLMP